jgi:hypothetical protein
MPLWLLSAFGFVKKAAGAALSAAIKYPWQTALLLSLVACAWFWRANSHLRDGIKAERAAHAQTVANFRKAQTEAEALQKANLTRVAKAQEDITDETVTDYRARLADLHARYDRLRTQGNRSASGNTGLPAVPDTAARVDEAPGENGLLAADALIASEQALQLDALITWVEAQAKVENSQ